MSAPTAKKSVKKVTATVSVPAPVEHVAVEAPSSSPAPAVKKVSKKTPAPVVAPVVTPVVAVEAPVEAPATTESSAEPTLADELKSVQDQLMAIRDSANMALASLKRASKRATQEIKDARKNRRKARAEPADGEPRKPSNFEIPKPITDELSLFFGGSKNNQMSRAQVTTAINKYVNENNLRVKHDITPNAALLKLLGIDNTVKLTIFNIQTYLGKHYVKPMVAPVQEKQMA